MTDDTTCSHCDKTFFFADKDLWTYDSWDENGPCLIEAVNCKWCKGENIIRWL